jgi:hypothetical protein
MIEPPARGRAGQLYSKEGRMKSIAMVLLGLAGLCGCSKSVDSSSKLFKVTSIKILRGEKSKVSDGDTFVFEAKGDHTTLHGESVNLLNVGDMLCRGSTGFVFRSANGQDCSSVVPNWIAEVTDETEK